jgi:undecaprenyl-diphosphatase
MAWERPIIRAADHISPPAANGWQALFNAESFALITVVIAVAALLDRRPRLALAGTVGCFAAVIAAEKVLKPLIGSRQALRQYRWFHPTIGSLTFPSGHVTAAAACATFAWFVLHRHTAVLAPLVFAVPVVVGWAMVTLGHHYPIDALGGIILGPLAVYAAVVCTSRLLGSDDPTAQVAAVAPIGGANPAERDPSGSS